MNTIKLLGAKAKYFASMHGPEGLMIAGIGGFIGTCVLVAKGAKKYEEVRDDENDTTVEKTKKAVICYAPAGVVGSLTLGCFTGGHYILKKRNVGLIAAYKVVDDSFKKYREAVIEKYGEDEDYRLKNGLRVEKETITEVGEDGKKHKKKVDVEYTDGELSGYSFILDDAHSMMSVSDPVIVMDQIISAENSANVLLKARGYLTLNEVLRSLGLHETSAGQIVGWQTKGEGDGYVDFRTRQVRSMKDDGGLAYILDFNVDGPIYQDIDKYTRLWGE